jgi:hypothetical protein
VTAPGNTDATTECALLAFAHRRAFWVRYYESGTTWFGYRGFAASAEGTVYFVEYSHGERIRFGEKEGKMMDDNHNLVVPCPKPTTLIKMKDGELTCVDPPSDSSTLAKRRFPNQKE